ncbi:hypothetical protein M8J77_003544 [Diaphorina citri]|nr:hypothetical protein M8J77_003544 [Diaphorina citri]
MTGFSCIECIGGRDVSRIKSVFSPNSELLFVVNGNKVDIHSSRSGDFIHSLNSEVSTSEQIVALFLNPINTKHLVAVFENGHVVTWVAESGNIESTSRLQAGESFVRVLTARCHVNVIEESSVDVYAVVEIKGQDKLIHKMKVFAYETGNEKHVTHKMFNGLEFEDVGSLNVIYFGGPDSIQLNGKTISGRYLCVTTGPKMFVIFLRCIFEPWFEQSMAMFNGQQIHLKSCWYQLGGGRGYTSVTCHPTDYNVAVGDNTGRVLVYTGVFLHAEDTRHDSTQERKRHLSQDKLTDSTDSSDDEDSNTSTDKTGSKTEKSGIKSAEKSGKTDKPGSKTESGKVGEKSPGISVGPVAKRSDVSRHMTWAITTVYHWHSFPVLDVMYSETGNFIFSGGGERTLIEWTLPHCKKPRTLPRLPGTIVNITSAPNGQMVVSTRDNSLHMIDQTSLMMKKVLASIQRLVRDEYQLDNPKTQVRTTSFLTHDPRTTSLVLNSRKGHIQFFSLTSNALLFNLDITEENIVSELHHETCVSSYDRQGTSVSHSDVLAVCLTHDGLCLASVEALGEHYVLKFWNYDVETKTFKLSSVISKPHKGRSINHLRFSPSRAEFNDPYTYTCVTSGSDDQYIVWTCSQSDKGISWSKDKEDNYHGLQAGPVGFSEDGSSLAVGFGPCLTLWDRHFELKCSLSHACDKSEKHFIRFLEWGQGPDCSHLLVGACSGWVRVWNTILGHNIWQVPLTASLLVSDPATSYMAVFTTDKIYVFKPSCSKPESIISTKRHNAGIAACFVATGGVPPSDDRITSESTKPWYDVTQLYFLTSKLELMYVKLLSTFEDKSAPLSLPYKPLQTKTPFSSMIAQEVTEETKGQNGEEEKEDKYENLANMGSIDKFLMYRPMSMAPLELLCAELIKSTLNKKGKSQATLPTGKAEHDTDVTAMDVDLLDINYDDVTRTPTSLSTMDDSCLMWIQNLV